MTTKLLPSSDKPRPPRAGMGRPAGVPNKATTAFRDTVNTLLADSAENVTKWIGLVAQQDPGRALDLLIKLAEFAVPKLSRQEVQAQVTDTRGPTRIEIVAAYKSVVLESQRSTERN